MPEMQKVAAGDPFEPSAGAWNRFIDATLFTEQQRNKLGAPGRPLPRFDGIYYVKNNTGSDQFRYASLGIDGPIFDPTSHFDSFSQLVSLSGVVPTDPEHLCKYVILQEPIPAGQAGFAWGSGLAPARISGYPESEGFAQIIAGNTTRLEYSDTDGYPIVWLSDYPDYDANGQFYWAIIDILPSAGCQTSNANPGGAEECCAPCRCYPTGYDLVTACSAVPCLYDRYEISGNLPFSGETILMHVSGCIYESDPFSVTICEEYYADHKWRLTVSADPHGSVLELICTGAGTCIPLVYKTYKAPFNPLCGNQFAWWFDCGLPTEVAHTFPCEVCVVAVGTVCDPCPVPVPPAVVTICCPSGHPAQIDAAFSGTGTCPGLIGQTVTLTSVAPTGGNLAVWEGLITPGSCGTLIVRHTLYSNCLWGTQIIDQSNNHVCINFFTHAAQCPLTSVTYSATWDGSGFGCPCCSGSISMTLTPTPTPT